MVWKCIGKVLENYNIGDELFNELDLTLEDLLKYNFDKHGNEVLYNGMTGEQLHTDYLCNYILSTTKTYVMWKNTF